jgi:hypothetical protein
VREGLQAVDVGIAAGVGVGPDIVGPVVGDGDVVTEEPYGVNVIICLPNGGDFVVSDDDVVARRPVGFQNSAALFDLRL